MVAADHASNYARKLGIQRDQLIQEWGWDEDTDDDIRAAIEEACGESCSMKTPTRSSMSSCCGGVMATAIWWTP